MKEDEESVESQVFGLPLRVRGFHMATLMILGLSLVFVILDVHTKMSAHHDIMVAHSKDIQSTMDEFVYIQSLPEEERMKLKLVMPDSLRGKLRFSDDRYRQ